MKKSNGTILKVNRLDLFVLAGDPNKFWKDVKFIGEYAFSKCKNLKRIEIPEGVEAIGENAFNGCKNLKKVKLPNSLKVIEKDAFKDCKNLENINIPKSVEKLSKLAFTNCDNLKNINEVPKIIDEDYFENIENLEIVEIPEGVETIGAEAFASCNDLKKIILPSTLKAIDEGAFFECKNLERIEIPEGVEELSDYICYCCENLKEIKLPSTLKTIGRDSFSGCKCLEKIEIPEGIEQLSNYLFFGCENLKEIKLPSSLKTIELHVFNGCESLEKIEIPEMVEKLGANTFSNCENLKEIKLPNSLKVLAEGAFSHCKNLESIEIPECVEKISDSLFYDCLNLKEVKLPSALKTIGESSFSNCENLEKIEIPEGVERICGNAFFSCSSLKEIKLPSTLKEISEHAFWGCKRLERLEIPQGVEKIDDYAFDGCSNLKEIKLPSTLKEIGELSFSSCSSLEKIEIPEGVEKVGEGAFSYCKNLESVTLPDSINSISVNVFRHCSRLKCFNFLGREWEASCDFFPTVYDVVENKERIEEISKADKWFKKQGLLIPAGIIDKDNLDEYLYNKEYKYMKNLLEIIPEEDRENNLPELYKIAKVMGILEKDDVTIKVNGKDMPVNGVAYTILQGAIKKGLLNFEQLHMCFQSLPNGEYNLEFLKFMSNKTNLEELLNHNSSHPGFFARVYNWYEDRTKLDINNQNDGYSSLPSDESNRYKIQTYKTMENGIDKIKWNVPTVELFIKEFASNKFSGIVDERSKEIGEYLSGFNLYEQRHFDKALEIDKERVESGVKDHLTSKIIKEDVVDSIEDYKQRVGKLKNDIAIELSDTLKTQTDTASKIFTYEMLAKSDKANFAIGFLTDCCATLYGAGAGAQRAMILHPDMQPLVIRNIKGEIVCFGIIYVNRKEGYAVVNDFEVNKKYNGKEVGKEIYTKAMQGVNAFVTQYNKENVNNPIKVVTSGLSPNWYAINCYIEQNKESEILKAPNFESYKYAGTGTWAGDWHKKQHVIWEMDKKEGDKR